MKKERTKTAIDTSESFLLGENLTDRLKLILEDVKKKSEIEDLTEFWKSAYYGSDQVGAVLYKGKWKDKNVVLKIQGVKPEISEIEMVMGFEEQNRSAVVRPPKFYVTFPWSDKLGYEAIIMEDVEGKKLIDSKKLQDDESLDKFFGIYSEYREKCINSPWLGHESDLVYGKEQFEKTKQMIARLKPDSILRKTGDIELALEATKYLNMTWAGRKSEFMHGHFSAEDLICQENEVILFSNLFWKWKHRYYDAVFAYHYCMIGLSHIEGATPSIVDSQRQLWLKKINSLSETGDDAMMLNAALLERMIACLLVDGIMFVNEQSSVADHLIESTREEIRRLVKGS